MRGFASPRALVPGHVPVADVDAPGGGRLPDAREGLEKARKGLGYADKVAAERAAQAMEDPKIREIWEASRTVLKAMTEDPDSDFVKKQLDDPIVQHNLAKLREVGLA